MAQSDAIRFESSTFDDGESIPERNSAYGDNVSPDLSWNGLPEGLATDPVLQSPGEIARAFQGPTGVGRPGYFGPRPPAGSGVHRYIFTLYAVDAESDELGLEEGLDEDGLMSAIEGHVLAEGELVGVFEREE